MEQAVGYTLLLALKLLVRSPFTELWVHRMDISLAQVLKCQGLNTSLAASRLLHSSSAHENMEMEMRHILWSWCVVIHCAP